MNLLKYIEKDITRVRSTYRSVIWSICVSEYICCPICNNFFINRDYNSPKDACVNLKILCHLIYTNIFDMLEFFTLLYLHPSAGWAPIVSLN